MVLGSLGFVLLLALPLQAQEGPTPAAPPEAEARQSAAGPSGEVQTAEVSVSSPAQATAASEPAAPAANPPESGPGGGPPAAAPEEPDIWHRPIPKELALAGIIGFVVLLVGGLGYAIMAMEKAVFNAARKAATELGCPHPPFRNKTLTEDYEVHQWDYNGVAMTIQAGSKVIAAPGVPTGAVPVMGTTVIAGLPKKLPFQLSVNRPRTLQGVLFKTGDPAFDEELWVVTSNDEAACKLLADAGLRQTIRELFQSERSVPTVRGWLTQGEVTVDGDWRIVRDSCIKAAALARSLTHKAEKLGLFSPAPPEAAPALPAAEPAGPAMTMDALATQFPSWAVTGPCLFREEGVYFFVKSITFVADKPGAGQLLGAGLGQGGALLGALGEAVGAAVDDGLREAPAKPRGLYFGSARDISERLGNGLKEVPDILNCREFFVVPRAAIQKVQLDGSGNLVLMTSGRTFTLSGGEMEKAKGFLAFRNYPVTG